VHLYSPGRIQLFSRFIITVVIIVLLLTPMVILYTQHTDLARFLTIGLSTLVFTTTLVLATTANKAHILAAAAASVPGPGSFWRPELTLIQVRSGFGRIRHANAVIRSCSPQSLSSTLTMSR